MKIHSVFITHNRLELTQRAVASYLDTVTCPFTYIVVDNGSSDGTKEWLNSWDHPYEALTINRYPGYACNRGWEAAPEDADFLHRADNDFVFLPGWSEEVERMFSENPRLGQLGLRTDEQEVWPDGSTVHTNVGGNCVIRRELWDAGLRYDETPWPEINKNGFSGFSEDSFMSQHVEQMEWEWDRAERPCIQSIEGEPSWDDPYYAKSWGDRSITRNKP